MLIAVVLTQQCAGLEDKPAGIGGMPVHLHRDGHFDRQGQHVQVILAQPFPPHLQRVVAEPDGLDMPATQVQPPHLIDDETAQSRIGRVQEVVLGLQVLQGQIVDRVVAAPVGVARVGFGQQDVDRGPVGQERPGPVLPELAPGDELDDPVHLDLVPGSVHLDQRQPVHLDRRRTDPLRRGEKLTQTRRFADRRRVLEEQLYRDRLGGEERAQVEQMLGVLGQQRSRQGPGRRDRDGRVRDAPR